MAKNVQMTIEDYGVVIYKVYSGSRSYGTNITEEKAKEIAKEKGGEWKDYASDVDIRGIFIPHPKYLYGPQSVDEFRDPSDEDTVYFSLGKFLRLALECNPNVVEQLFVRDEDVLFMNEIGKELRDMRMEFLTKNCFGRFGSYAWSQLNRMTNRTEGFDRNVKRQKLIEAVGGNWDPKNGMHLIRLLKMCLQILREGTLETYCRYYQFLLDIRNGKYTAEEVIDMANDLFDELEVALKESTVPNVPDFDKINRWAMNAVDRTFGGNSNVGIFQEPTLKNLPLEYEMVDKCTMFLVSNPLIRKKNKSEAQGVVIPYKDWFSGLYEFSEFKFEKTTIEHLYKFVHQLRGCNPRHIDTVFAPESEFLHKHPMTDELFNVLKTLPTTKRAFHTAKGYITGNLQKMKNWETLKERHEELRQKVKDAKNTSKETWGKKWEELEAIKQSEIERYKKLFDDHMDKIVEIHSEEERNQWRNELDTLNQQYRIDMEKRRNEKDRWTKKHQEWLELSNKKGNMPTFPPIPDKTPNDNASVMGKFSYDTILASDLYHVVKMFIELMKEGTIENSRAFEDEMQSIRHGKYKTFDEFHASMEPLIKELEDASKDSKLGTHDYSEIEKFLIDFIQRYHETL